MRRPEHPIHFLNFNYPVFVHRVLELTGSSREPESLNIVVSADRNCVYVDPNRSEDNVVLFGRVERVQDQDGWIVTRLRLCGSGLTEVATIKVLTPAGAGLVDIGEEGEYQGKPVFPAV